MLKKRLCFPIIIIAALLLTGCSFGKKEVYLITDETTSRLFSMGDMACQKKEFELYLANYKNLYGEIYGTNVWTSCKNTDELKTAVKTAAFSQLTEVYALNLYAAKNEIILSESEMALCAEAAKEYFGSLTADEITLLELTENDIYEMYLKYALAEKTYSDLIRDVDSEVSEDEARVMDALVIYCTDKAEADEALQKITDGTDFETVASNYSRLASLEVSFGRGDYEQVIEDEVFSLDNKKYTQVISASDGYYIFYCVDKYNEELSEEKKVQIYNERKDGVLEEIYGNYQTEVTAEINKSMYDEIEVIVSDVIETDSFFSTLDRHISFSL